MVILAISEFRASLLFPFGSAVVVQMLGLLKDNVEIELVRDMLNQT
jgi:hypothetical protein